MNVRLYDAHNHLQDERLAGHLDSIFAAIASEPIEKMVVNGSCEADWTAVLELARKHPQVVPSLGYHPWYVNECSADWKQELVSLLDEGNAAIGEIGLDLWIKDHDIALQEEVFVWQLRVAVARNVPVSIHCLQAWGRLLELLRQEQRPQGGFLLHSFGGSKEMIAPLAELGAYFSLPGYFAHERKQRQRETFRYVPADRLLIETDAPDQPLPPERTRYTLSQKSSPKPLNHPANLRAVYEFAAELLGQPYEVLAAQVEKNFLRLFRNWV